MTVLTCASTGKSITLLGEPIVSGEGKVWRTNHNGYLAKIYHSQTPERVQKLAVMIAHRPKEPNSHLNHVSFAWPKSVLKDAQGDCVGFLMPEIKEGKELIDVYNPKKRKDLKLEVDWRFLHTTALNIASIIEAIHISGYVLGDIKPQNILVNDRALPSIIDTDSFQVRNPKNNKVYRCSVGSDGFTPPELIGKDFDTIDQTEVHDRFRLAVIIYQLLFGGQTPFAGKWIGTGETPETNELIRQGLWLYAPNRLIQPVERTIPLEIIHPEVQRCFLRCFNDGYKNPNLRPTAGDWVKVLRLAVNELTICGKVDSHYYSRTYGKCYWCDRSTKLSVDIFPGVVKAKASAVVESTSQPSVINNDVIGKLLQTLTGHSKYVSSVAFSPDGQTLASGSGDETIKIWNVSTGRLLQTLTGHSKYVSSVAFSPDGQTLASGSQDKTIKLWNVTTGKLLQSLTDHSHSVNSVVFSPDGHTLASGSYDNTIKIWNVSTGRLLQSFSGHSNWVRYVAFSPNGQTLASGSDDNTVKLWDVNRGNLRQTLTGHSNWVRYVAFSPDGQTLASGSQDETIKLWNVTTGKLLQSLTDHSHSVNSVAFSPDGHTIASGSGDKSIKIWNVTTGELLQTLTAHSRWVTSVIYSPDGQTLASGSDDGTIKIWQAGTSINRMPVQQTQYQVSQSAFSKPQNQAVISQPTATSTTTNNSSSVKQTQSQLSQTNQPANLSGVSRRGFLQAAGGFLTVVVMQNIFSYIQDGEFRSSSGMDYTKLRDLLAEGKWKEANEFTTLAMLAVIKKTLRGRLYLEFVDSFPCEDIHIIDNLWVKYSNGSFGFSVQKRIYQSLGGTNDEDHKIWLEFGKKVGWIPKNFWLYYYGDLTFDIIAPEGHLPIGLVWGNGGVLTLSGIWEYNGGRGWKILFSCSEL